MLIKADLRLPQHAISKSSGTMVIQSFEKWLRRALGFVSIDFIFLFLYTAHGRMRYPFSLDQIEGGLLTSLWRIAHGFPLYTKPTLDFVPYLYPPVYLYLAAALSNVTGIGYATLRLLSVLSSLGSMCVIYAIILYETKRHLPSLSGAGLFAACYLPVGAWLDIGRVDSLFVFLLLLAVYCTCRAPIVLAALIWVIAFQTKQTILPVAVLILCANWQQPKRLILGLTTLFVGVTGSVMMLNYATGGWYDFYVFGTPRGLGWSWRQAVFYIPTDLLLPFGFTFLLILAALVFAPPALRSKKSQFYMILSFAIYASIWFVRSHDGSSTNALMPAYAWTAVLFGICLHRLCLWLNSTAFPQADVCVVIVLAVAIVQFLILLYHPGRFVPSTQTQAARWSFEKELNSLPGDVYVLNHSYDAILAGKQPHAVVDAFGIIINMPPSLTRTAFIEEMKKAIDSHRYSAFVLDDDAAAYEPGVSWMPSDFVEQYPVQIRANGIDTPDVTGTQPKEKWIYLTCSDLDHDLNSIITSSTLISYGDCPNARVFRNR
jgi:hypothetical protein